MRAGLSMVYVTIALLIAVVLFSVSMNQEAACEERGRASEAVFTSNEEQLAGYEATGSDNYCDFSGVTKFIAALALVYAAIVLILPKARHAGTAEYD